MSDEQANAERLRTAAEARLAAPMRRHLEDELLHELQVHQIELEMQNEALRQSQIALEASRDRYARLYDLAPVGYLTLSNSGMITAINLAGAALLGAERAKLITQRFSKFVVADDRDRWHRQFIHLMQQRQDKYSGDLFLQPADGSPRTVLIECRYAAVEGSVGELLLTLPDISERALLQQSEQHFRAVFERSPIGIGIARPDGRYRLVNAAMCQMLGYSEAELLKLSGSDITHPDDIRLNRWNVDGLVAGEASHFSMEKRYIRKDGEIVRVSLNVVAVSQCRGHEIYTIELAEDISRRKLTTPAVEEIPPSAGD